MTIYKKQMTLAVNLILGLSVKGFDPFNSPKTVINVALD
jgi:hypothetical protein